MYPYLEFFNEPKAEGMDFLNDIGTDDEDLRSHLNARMETDRAHPEEPELRRVQLERSPPPPRASETIDPASSAGRAQAKIDRKIGD